MRELIVKDSDFYQAEEYINQFMKEFTTLCERYFRCAMTIHENGLENSVMLEVIHRRSIPFRNVALVENQVRSNVCATASELEKALFLYEFMNGKIKQFILQIDEIDTILY